MSEENSVSQGCGCISLVVAIALVFLLFAIWHPLVDFCTRWLNSH